MEKVDKDFYKPEKKNLAPYALSIGHEAKFGTFVLNENFSFNFFEHIRLKLALGFGYVLSLKHFSST